MNYKSNIMPLHIQSQSHLYYWPVSTLTLTTPSPAPQVPLNRKHPLVEPNSHDGYTSSAHVDYSVEVIWSRHNDDRHHANTLVRYLTQLKSMTRSLQWTNKVKSFGSPSNRHQNQFWHTHKVHLWFLLSAFATLYNVATPQYLLAWHKSKIAVIWFAHSPLIGETTKSKTWVCQFKGKFARIPHTNGCLNY